MIQVKRCILSLLNRRNLKKVRLVGCILILILIIINTGDLFRCEKNIEVRNYEISEEMLFRNLGLKCEICRTLSPEDTAKKDLFTTLQFTELQKIYESSAYDEEMESTEEVQTTHHQLWMDLMALRMEKRRKKLQKGCEHLRLNVRGNDSLHRPNEWEFLINRPFHLVWCNVFKAASTSWMYNFNILAGYDPQFLKDTSEVPLQLARKKYPRPSLKFLEAALNDSTSFLIVRHPFERLLSGYRDKIKYAIPDSYHYKLGNHIVMRYRKSRKKERNFSFFNYLKTRKDRPTFVEFVKFLLQLYESGKPMDMHWMPVTSFCTPCQVRFDIIMKFETLEDDQQYLIQKQNLQNWIKPQWKNKSKGKENLMELLHKYYSQLSAEEIFQLYNMYRYDFYLFGYTIDDYLTYLNLDGVTVPSYLENP